MDIIYVLYSKNRRFVYLNDEPLDKFWALYLKNRFPKDTWIETTTENVTYIIDVAPYAKSTVAIYDSTPTARSFRAEIKGMRDHLAVLKLGEMAKPNDIFIVSKDRRDATVVLYAGHSLDAAFDTYTNTRDTQGVEVYRDGKCVQVLYDITEYKIS